MKRGPVWLLGLGALACGPGKPGNDTIAAEQVQFCVEMLCDKALSCHGAIEPSDDFEQRCWQGCSSLLEQALAEGCAAQLQALLDCADAAECDPYLDWSVFEQPDAVCSSEEQQLRDACPDLQFREP